MRGVTSTKTGSGTNDGDIVIQLDNIESFDTYMLQSTAGSMEVFVSLDGTNYSTAPLSLLDLGANTAITLALSTTANRTFAFRGKYKSIRVQQNGATAVEDAAVRYGIM